MTDQVWSWLAAGIGLFGFYLSGKKVWWSWYVNLINQAAWIIFALVTGYYAFLVSAGFYTAVFARNAYLWTKEHRLKVHEDRLNFETLRNYAEKDVETTMQLFQGEDALKLMGIQGHSYKINTGEVEPYEYLRHIRRLEDRIPICQRPDDPNTFVINDIDASGPPCVECQTTIQQWNSLDPHSLVSVTGKAYAVNSAMASSWGMEALTLGGEKVLLSAQDMHICHSGPAPNHTHAFSCPTGEHIGWRHPDGPHKQCRNCR